MEWPQITLIVLLALEMIVVAAYHGKPRPDWNISWRIIDTGFLIWILYMGGFWT